ncbi:MAG: methyltransferase domain-containing protein [Ilumatobacteraceae bacterium]
MPSTADPPDAVDGWDPGQYERFAAERAQPFWDLAGLLDDRPIRRMVDLGCGTGSWTVALADRVGATDVTGVDSSSAMLAAAAELPARPGLTFVHGDVSSWTSRPDHDLVFSNAALQWVPDHVGVVTRWWAAVRPGGQLAVQIPSNADHPSHRLAGRLASEEPFRSALGVVPPDQVAANVLAPEQYAILLDQLGAARQHVRLQVYGHALPRTSDVVEWVRGTTLTRFSRRMSPELFEEFVAEYRRRLVAALGDRSPYFYPFKRILFWGAKGSGG